MHNYAKGNQLLVLPSQSTSVAPAPVPPPPSGPSTPPVASVPPSSTSAPPSVPISVTDRRVRPRLSGPRAWGRRACWFGGHCTRHGCWYAHPGDDDYDESYSLIDGGGAGPLMF